MSNNEICKTWKKELDFYFPKSFFISIFCALYTYLLFLMADNFLTKSFLVSHGQRKTCSDFKIELHQCNHQNLKLMVFHAVYIYRTCAIITRDLYIFTPSFTEVYIVECRFSFSVFHSLSFYTIVIHWGLKCLHWVIFESKSK